MKYVCSTGVLCIFTVTVTQAVPDSYHLPYIQCACYKDNINYSNVQMLKSAAIFFTNKVFTKNDVRHYNELWKKKMKAALLVISRFE